MVKIELLEELCFSMTAFYLNRLKMSFAQPQKVPELLAATHNPATQPWCRSYTLNRGIFSLAILAYGQKIVKIITNVGVMNYRPQSPHYLCAKIPQASLELTSPAVQLYQLLLFALDDIGRGFGHETLVGE